MSLSTFSWWTPTLFPFSAAVKPSCNDLENEVVALTTFVSFGHRVCGEVDGSSASCSLQFFWKFSALFPIISVWPYISMAYKGSFSSTSSPACVILFFFFLVAAIRAGVRGPLTVLLICICLAMFPHTELYFVYDWLMWEVLLSMCCFYWLMSKEAALACDRTE